LARTCEHEFGAPIFSCHQSRDGEEFPCAGWLAVYGHRSIAVRIMVMRGDVAVEALTPDNDWPELHQSFDEVIEKLRATDTCWRCGGGGEMDANPSRDPQLSRPERCDVCRGEGVVLDDEEEDDVVPF